MEPLKIKRRGELSQQIISVRLEVEAVKKLDQIAAETNYSRNQIICKIIEHGLHTLEISEK